MFKDTDILTANAVLDYAGQKLITVDGRVLPTGFADWDRACDDTGQKGLGEWWYLIIGGASNSGKTHLLRHLARQAANYGYTPAIITMEVSAHGLQRRYYSDISSFGYYDLLPSHFEKDGIAKVEKLRDEIVQYAEGIPLPKRIIVAEATGRPSIHQILEKAHELREEQGITHLFVDHAQLIKSGNMDIAQAAEELSENMRIFAHQGKVCTVMASQLNRGASAQRDRRPIMHDLWGGTAMESNANQVILLDHSRNEKDPMSPHLLRTYLLLDKNREGPAKIEIPVEIDFRSGDWRQAMPDEAEGWP